jgi:hypothetical protein
LGFAFVVFGGQRNWSFLDLPNPAPYIHEVSSGWRYLPQGGVAQSVRASACHAEGRGFESRHSRHFGAIYDQYPRNLAARIRAFAAAQRSLAIEEALR